MRRLHSWGSNKYMVYLMHVFFWLLLMLPLLMDGGNPRFAGGGFRYRMLFNNIGLLVLFYWNANFLYAAVYKRRGTLVYVLLLLVSALILLYGVHYAVDRWQPPIQFDPHFAAGQGSRMPPPGPRSPLFQFPFFLAIMAVSFSYALIREHNRQEKERKERETEQLKTELGLLRSQISPHFMFNVLNSLVALARKKSDLLEPSLLQLSTLMRYALYENKHSRIALSEEVAYLKNYIELQSLRFGDDVEVDVELYGAAEGTEQQVLERYEIEPMLLIPFIENAFKHGIGSINDPFIRIRLNLDEAAHSLTFSVANKIGQVQDVKDEASGIGMRNVKRRLELLYPEKHVFRVSAEAALFEAILILKL